jgi:hypothetical protein
MIEVVDEEEEGEDAVAGAVVPIRPKKKISGVSISHPLVDRLRDLLQEESKEFTLPEDLVFKKQQAPASSAGWARCEAPDGVVVYINTKKKVCTTEAPAIDGWTLRKGVIKVEVGGEYSTSSSEAKEYYYENTLNGDVSVDVPEPIQE